MTPETATAIGFSLALVLVLGRTKNWFAIININDSPALGILADLLICAGVALLLGE
ncbi:hypothetical protein UFOVP1299_28 [uncultured Caudovirales phage]|uniref:Uncharacterized protein n=1 Tax=uncultured Caudovirales phage TaxID=2100421 RepID=A0A6J5RN96_9CAUD|nr:hypothetical protein UFOVP1299_28 [uncultured Caudovirales phage]